MKIADLDSEKKLKDRTLLEGKRGHGGQVLASKIWGITEEEYLEIADPWPLNPKGQLILGIKLENKTAISNAPRTLAVPGICFGDYGLGDISFSLGYKKALKFPFPKKIIDIRNKVWKICTKNKKYFWAQATQETIIEMIDQGLRFIRVYDKSISVKGRIHTKRNRDW